MAQIGSVTLVGAGPGDPDLLTLKAVKAIARADVVLIDDLVNPAILAHAAQGVRVVEVGKRGGCASTPQAFIERLMLYSFEDKSIKDLTANFKYNIITYICRHDS